VVNLPVRFKIPATPCARDLAASRSRTLGARPAPGSGNLPPRRAAGTLDDALPFATVLSGVGLLLLIVLAIVVGAALGRYLLRWFPARLQSARQRVLACAFLVLQPMAAYALQLRHDEAGRVFAWLLAALFLASAPGIFTRSGEDLDRYTDTVRASGGRPSGKRLLELLLYSLSIIVAGTLMLLVVDRLVVRAGWLK